MAPPPKAAPNGRTTISEATSRGIRPPSLAIAINEFAVGPDRTKDGSDAIPPTEQLTAKHLEKVLTDICNQLTDDSFDTNVWEKTAAGQLPIPPSTDAEKLEEAWARGIDELTFGTAYTGPDIIPSFPPKSLPTSAIHYVYSRFSLDPEGKGDWSVPSDPAMSLGMACQHMTTYGLLARGVSLADANGVGIACSQSNAALPIFKNRWHSEESPTPDAKDKSIAFAPIKGEAAHTVKELVKISDFGPGTVYTYNPLGYTRSMLTIADPDDCLKNKDGTPHLDGEGNYILAPGKAIQKTLDAQAQQQALQKEAPGVALDTRGALENENKEAEAQKPGAIKGVLDGGKVIAKMGLAAQLDGSHAAMVLRVYKTKAYNVDATTTSNMAAGAKDSQVGEQMRVQMLDSGARIRCPEVADADITNDYAVITAKSAGEGHICGEGYTRFDGSAANFVGFGTVPAIDHGDAVKAMLAKARHVGVARLAISLEKADPKEGDFVYLSKCIPLWSDTKSFTLARLAWSLRNSAFAKNLRAYWIVYSPRGYLAKAMWAEGARSSSLSKLVTDSIADLNATETLDKNKRDYLSVAADLLPIAAFSTTPEGKAIQIWRGHCLAASGKGSPPQAVRNLFINTAAPDLTLFHEMEKKFKSDWEAERQRLKAKQDAVNKICSDKLTTYKKSKDADDLKVFQLAQKHQLAGDYDWFDATHDRDTYDADIEADKAKGFTGKPPSTTIEPPALAAYHDWGKTPYAPGHAHPLELARGKIDSEYCSLADSPAVPALLK